MSTETYSFRFSAIAGGSLQNVVATGGYYGSAGTYISVSGTHLATEEEITNELDYYLYNLWALMHQDFTNDDSVLVTVQANQTYTDPTRLYKITGTPLSGTITFLSNDPDATFYVYAFDQTTDLSDVVITCAGNIQTYNLYILSKTTITLGPRTYPGNFLVGDISGVTDTSVDGSVSALINSTYASTGTIVNVNVRMGVPRYVSTYTAIAPIIIDTEINGTKYGINSNYNTSSGITGTAVEDTYANAVTEMTYVTTFINGAYGLSTFLSNAVYSANNIDISTTSVAFLSPISTNSYYTITGEATSPVTFTFLQSSTEDVFYLYNGTNNINLNKVTFSGGSNIYIVGNIISLTGNTAGTFLFTGSLTGTSTPTILGSVYGYGSSSVISGVRINFNIPCFLSGTKILTAQWYVPVEQLKVGDLVMVSGELHGKCHVVGEGTPMQVLRIQKHVRKASASTSPIVITKNAFGANTPFEDLYVSPNHGIITRGGKMVNARKMVNGGTIYNDPSFDVVTYYHLEFDRHYSVTANGVLTESYKDSTILL